MRVRVSGQVRYSSTPGEIEGRLRLLSMPRPDAAALAGAGAIGAKTTGEAP
jgi:hypothetical protein